MERPEIVTDEHLEYLDTLRDTGITNMFGAGTYIENAFKLDRKDSQTVLSYWMDTFGHDNR